MILITGGMGFIGLHVAKRFLDKGLLVTVVGKPQGVAASTAN